MQININTLKNAGSFKPNVELIMDNPNVFLLQVTNIFFTEMFNLISNIKKSLDKNMFVPIKELINVFIFCLFLD